jgi:hypothetical protein
MMSLNASIPTRSIFTLWFCVLLIAMGLPGCTTAPHIGQSQFEDAWGDRGAQVFARDVAWCAEAVESRRSLWSGCMQQRGWLSRPSVAAEPSAGS